MSRRGLWIVPLLVGCIAAAAFVVLRLGGGSSMGALRRAASALRRSQDRGARVDILESTLDVPAFTGEPEGAIEGVDELVPQEDPRAEIARTNAAYLGALLRSDAEAYAGSYLDEALAVPPSGPVLRGRKAIEDAMVATFATYRFLSAEMARIDVRLLGETAIETGHYRYDVSCPSTGVEQTLSGRYAIVWKWHENAWRIAFDTTQPGVFA